MDLKQFETDGYVVIPKFLSEEELEQLRQDYYAKKENRDQHAIFSRIKFLNEKIKPVLDTIAEQTNIDIDVMFPGVKYWDTHLDLSKVQKWHQDHEAWYKWQESYNTINFWMPIIKPNKDRSGIQVIPFSKLRERLPGITEEHIVAKGARQFTSKPDGKTMMRDDDVPYKLLLDVDFEDIKVTPDLEPGDVLIMRWDTIHRTQDIIDHRVAVSIRGINSNRSLTRDKFYTGSEPKMEQIYRNAGKEGYQKILSFFEDTTVQEVPLVSFIGKWKIR